MTSPASLFAMSDTDARPDCRLRICSSWWEESAWEGWWSSEHWNLLTLEPDGFGGASCSLTIFFMYSERGGSLLRYPNPELSRPWSLCRERWSGPWQLQFGPIKLDVDLALFFFFANVLTWLFNGLLHGIAQGQVPGMQTTATGCQYLTVCQLPRSVSWDSSRLIEDQRFIVTVLTGGKSIYERS